MTTRKQTILLERNKIYCKQLGLDVVPEILWTKKEMKKLPVKIRGSRLGKFTWGWCPQRANLIFICYSRHGSLTELDNTLRHELIHFRFPKMGHTKTFDLFMKNLKNGMLWPPWDRNAHVLECLGRYAEWAFRRLFL